MTRVTFEDLKFEGSKEGVLRARHQFGSYTISVIKEPQKSLYEVAIFDQHMAFVQLPGIHRTPEDQDDFVDDVIPYVSPEQVSGIMIKLLTLQEASA